MGKLIQYSHNIAKHEIVCLVTYTLQGKTLRLEVIVTESALLAADAHWGINTLCTLLTNMTSFTVTV